MQNVILKCMGLCRQDHSNLYYQEELVCQRVDWFKLQKKIDDQKIKLSSIFIADQVLFSYC